jgi:hypothetical protein
MLPEDYSRIAELNKRYVEGTAGRWPWCWITPCLSVW